MFWQLVVIEEIKLSKRALLWVSVGLMALAILALDLTIYSVLQTGNLPDNMQVESTLSLEGLATWPQGLISSLELAAGSNLGGILMVVIVGIVAGQAYTWRTLSLWLGRGVSRNMLLLARFVALFVPALLVTLASLLAGGGITAVFSQLLLGHIPAVNWTELLLAFLRTAYTLLPYAAMTFFLAVLTRSTVTAVAGGLSYALLIEGIVVQLLALAGGIWAKLGQFLPAGLTQSLLGMNARLVSVGNGSLSAPSTLAPQTAVWLIAFYTLGFFLAALFIFRRQDIS
ncbi:MAG: hypothetical protein D6706_03610 [Chloroflexi bacterium]|nr:MAG: hypothetical protein D6706_03610 [Chloroflexota bacterium]